MPNWVSNVVYFEGEPERIKELLNKVKSKENEFDFDKILPTPRGYLIAEDFLHKYQDAPLKECIDENFDEAITAFVVDKLGKDCTEQDIKDTIKAVHHDKIKQGAVQPAWYQWRCERWGTKWNTDGATADETGAGFNTAWSTPAALMQILSEQFPDIKIKVLYADEDIGNNCGTYELLGGRFISEEEGDLKFACELWGYDYEDLMAERNQDS